MIIQDQIVFSCDNDGILINKNNITGLVCLMREKIILKKMK